MTDGRVVSAYVGTGTVGELAAEMDELTRAVGKRERAMERRERASYEEVTRFSRKAEMLVRLMTYANLLATGHHTHKGQWRRSRQT